MRLVSDYLLRGCNKFYDYRRLLIAHLYTKIVNSILSNPRIGGTISSGALFLVLGNSKLMIEKLNEKCNFCQS
jgi:hypothetical protein